MAAEQAFLDAIYGENFWDLILEHNSNISFNDIPLNSSYRQPVNSQYSILYLPKDTSPPLSISTYGYSAIPKCFAQTDIESVDAMNVNPLKNQPSLSLSGQGVLVGIIDSGIDYTNPLFQHNDGTTRIAALWDQTILSSDTSKKAPYGTDYSSTDINIALQANDPLSIIPSVDSNGHGTMIAGLIAGNADLSNQFTGIATRSELVVIKLKESKQCIRNFWAIPDDVPAYQTNDIMLGVRYLLLTAAELQRPLVICIALGNTNGGLGLSELLTDYLSSIAEINGFCVVGSIGNEGLSQLTYHGSANPPLQMDSVELFVGHQSSFTIELWGKTPNIYSIGILTPTGEHIQRISPKNAQTSFFKALLETSTIRVDSLLSERKSGQFVIVITLFNASPGIWRFEVFKESFDDSNYYMRLPIHNFISNDVYFLKSSPPVTMVTPSAGDSIITVTAYNHHNSNRYAKASQGYIDNFIVKPDLAAPGVDLRVPDLNHGYTTATGTSLAAANVAGCAALILEWAIVQGNETAINGLGVRNLLLRGADKVPNMTFPNTLWGYGKINLYRSYEALFKI